MDEKTSGEISAPEDIALLASGVRQELVDTLAAMGGEASVGELANELVGRWTGCTTTLNCCAKVGW